MKKEIAINKKKLIIRIIILLFLILCGFLAYDFYIKLDLKLDSISEEIYKLDKNLDEINEYSKSELVDNQVNQEELECSNDFFVMSYLYQLKIALLQSRDYYSLLEDVMKLSAENQDLQDLNKLLSPDFKTISQLQDEFVNIEQRLVFNDNVSAINNTFLKKIYEILSDFILVRKIGERALKDTGVRNLIEKIYIKFSQYNYKEILDIANEIQDDFVEFENWKNSLANFVDSIEKIDGLIEEISKKHKCVDS